MSALASSPGRRVARHTGWQLAAHLAVTAMLFVQAALVTRALGSAGFGELVLAMCWVLIVAQLLDWRSWEPITRYLPEFRSAGRPDRAAGVLQLGALLELGSGMLAMVIILATAPLAAAWLLKDPAAAGLIVLFAPAAILMVPVNPGSALLRLADRPGRLSAQRVASGAVQTAGTAIVCAAGPTLEALLLVQLAGLAVGAALLGAMGASAARALGVPAWRAGALASLAGRRREVLRFFLLTNLTGCSRVVTGRADTLILGLLATPAAVGLYDVAKQVTAQLRELAGPLQMSVFPEMSRLAAEGEHDALRRLQRQVTVTLLALTVPVCIAVTVAAPWLVPMAFGDAFAGSVPLVQILVWHLLWLPTLWVPGSLLVLGRAGTLTALQWIDALIFVVLLAALVVPLGPVGAACVVTFRYLAWIGVNAALWRDTIRRTAATHDSEGPSARAAA